MALVNDVVEGVMGVSSSGVLREVAVEEAHVVIYVMLL